MVYFRLLHIAPKILKEKDLRNIEYLMSALTSLKSDLSRSSLGRTMAGEPTASREEVEICNLILNSDQLSSFDRTYLSSLGLFQRENEYNVT
ncbi:Oidioi.mRNA.OKI2018_I69.chr1.g1968.t1.cds [Oikopleura dioica]|uniref:Oidioi.mRNA.OKI2018_I69.chr1.g1968.t1.cds n=1 Tax=Oikopleura dioica TaxID=34765 RepID=A0ABN7SUW5_OIKDI|nr:Oidioi.mRNA.OKI2018_I69.chr1.g1968.t1.cds [Oikopleura dioica]